MIAGAPCEQLSDTNNLLPVSHFLPYDLRVEDLPMIMSILRMSHKYEVPSLRRRAIDALQSWYPTTLEGYNTLARNTRARELFRRHVLVANIARETDALSLLPSALLLCCTTSNVRTLYDGIEADGVLHRLVEINRRALFIGRPKLSHLARTKSQRCFFYPQEKDRPKCQGASRCEDFCKIYSSVFDDKEDPWMNPLFPVNWNAIRSTCCKVCGALWEEQYKNATKEIWEELPTYLGLPPWADILETQKSPDSPTATSPITV